MATALRLARERSPAGITTADITISIGITQGTVFRHFASWDAIWLAAMRSPRETLLQGLLDTARRAGGQRTPLTGHLKQSIERKPVSADLDTEVAAASFIGLIQGLVMLSVFSGHPAAMGHQADALRVLFRRSLGEAAGIARP